MPELPEVETRVREMREPTVGQTITAVRLNWPRHIHELSPDGFTDRIVGQKVTAVTRRAKYLRFHLTQDVMLIHLRMSGDLRIEAIGTPDEKHDHTTFELSNGTEMRFTDPRKFGRVYLVADPDTVTAHIGPEPLVDEFTPEIFGAMLRKRKRALKTLLLDQTFLAGVGNIYCDEALHMAKLHPQTISNTLTDSQVSALWASIREALNEGIRHNGSSIDWVYKGGDHQYHFGAYGRTGDPCFTCGTAIKRIIVGQRGTHFCPQCQVI